VVCFSGYKGRICGYEAGKIEVCDVDEKPLKDPQPEAGLDGAD
jgi:hypothetical protein